MFNREKKGFSLVELILVITIIAILISISVPVIASARNNSKNVRCYANLRSLGSALTMYEMDYKSYFENTPSFPSFGLVSEVETANIYSHLKPYLSDISAPDKSIRKYPWSCDFDKVYYSTCGMSYSYWIGDVLYQIKTLNLYGNKNLDALMRTNNKFAYFGDVVSCHPYSQINFIMSDNSILTLTR